MTHLRKPWEFEEPACAEVGTSLFFSKDHDDPEYSALEEDNYKYARQVCAVCPHKVECAEWGIAYEKHGMWGGLSPKERTAIKKSRAYSGISLPFRIV